MEDTEKTSCPSLFYDSHIVRRMELTDDLIAHAKAVVKADTTQVTDFRKQILLGNAVRSWDLFYKRNNDNFFKDRNWMLKEFLEIRQLNNSVGDVTDGEGGRYPIGHEPMAKRDSLATICTTTRFITSLTCNTRISNNNNAINSASRTASVQTKKIGEASPSFPTSAQLACLTTFSSSTSLLTTTTANNAAAYTLNPTSLEVARDPLPLLVDIGCGVGNALLPILRECRNLSAIGFDCSKRAIEMLRESYLKRLACGSAQSRKEGRLLGAYVWDITEADIPSTLCNAEAADMLLLTFVLSALPPSSHADASWRCAKLLKPGGIILLRDYGRYDLAQLRFARSGKSRLSENFYTRYDGTFAFYFLKEDLRELFVTKCGLEEVDIRYEAREVTNRKTGVRMKRVWVQAKFRKPTV